MTTPGWLSFANSVASVVSRCRPARGVPKLRGLRGPLLRCVLVLLLLCAGVEPNPGPTNAWRQVPGPRLRPPQRQEPAPRPQRQRQEQISVRPACLDFARGCCRRGSACRFEHRHVGPDELFALRRDLFFRRRGLEAPPLQHRVEVHARALMHRVPQSTQQSAQRAGQRAQTAPRAEPVQTAQSAEPVQSVQTAWRVQRSTNIEVPAAQRQQQVAPQAAQPQQETLQSYCKRLVRAGGNTAEGTASDGSPR